MADQTLDLGAYLAALEAQRATLAIQIAGVREALGLPPETNGNMPSNGVSVGGTITPRGTLTGAVGRVRGDEFFRMSVPEAIKRYLEIMKQPQTPKDIAEGLKSGGILSEAKHFYANVFTALKRLRSQGVVMNTKRGWGLSEWYAGRSGTGVDSKPKRGKKNAKRGRKSKKGAGATATATAASGQPSGYRAFVGQQMKAGKTMAEAAAAWRKQKGDA